MEIITDRLNHKPTGQPRRKDKRGHMEASLQISNSKLVYVEMTSNKNKKGNYKHMQKTYNVYEKKNY